MHTNKCWLVLAGLALLLSAGCDDDETPAGGDANTSLLDGSGILEGGTNVDKGWTTDDSGVVQVGDGGVVIVEDGGANWVCYKTTCAAKLLECGDCIDNDGDGKIDAKDPECLGPCDNTEGPALIGGVGGGAGMTCKVDCYFDYGNGPGNDDCIWDHVCDPLEPEANLGCLFDQKTADDPNKCPKTQSQTCTDFCLPYTPNGCDCFGCCTFPQLAGLGPNGTDGYVWIGAMDDKKQGTCTFADILDKTKCPRCTPIDGCLNACGKCELCIGKTTLPPECFQQPDGGIGDSGVGYEAGVPPSQQCPGGEQPCGLPGQAACPQGYYCISGCCVKVDID